MRPAPSTTEQGEEVSYWSPSGEKAGLAGVGTPRAEDGKHGKARAGAQGAAADEAEDDGKDAATAHKQKDKGEAESLGGWSAKHQKSIGGKKLLAGAATHSNNRVYFAPPYDGGSSLRFIVASSNQEGANVQFAIDRGRMVCARSSDCYATVRFDDGEPQRFSLTLLPDTLVDSVSIRDKGYFLAKARQARSIAIQLNFDQQGRTWFDFDVTRMRWPTKKAK